MGDGCPGWVTGAQDGWQSTWGQAQAAHGDIRVTPHCSCRRWHCQSWGWACPRAGLGPSRDRGAEQGTEALLTLCSFLSCSCASRARGDTATPGCRFIAHGPGGESSSSSTLGGPRELGLERPKWPKFPFLGEAVAWQPPEHPNLIPAIPAALPRKDEGTFWLTKLRGAAELFKHFTPPEHAKPSPLPPTSLTEHLPLPPSQKSPPKILPRGFPEPQLRAASAGGASPLPKRCQSQPKLLTGLLPIQPSCQAALRSPHPLPGSASHLFHVFIPAIPVPTPPVGGCRRVPWHREPSSVSKPIQPLEFQPSHPSHVHGSVQSTHPGRVRMKPERGRKVWCSAAATRKSRAGSTWSKEEGKKNPKNQLKRRQREHAGVQGRISTF